MTVLLLGSCSPSLKRQFKKNEVFEKSFSGLMIYDPSANKTLFKHNPHKYFTPASNTKLLTYYAGLKYLGDSIPGLIYNIKGDTLFFKSAADPSFLNPKFKNTATFDFLKGTHKELVYLKSNWQDTAFGSGWAWDDYNYSFAAEKSAFPVYGNLLEIEYSGGENIKVTPSLFRDSISNTEMASSAKRLQNKNQFAYSQNSQAFDRKIPFLTSEDLSIALLKDTLKKPISVQNKKIEKSEEKIMYSIPADSLYKEMLQSSDNFIAEQILLMISLKISDTLKTEISINKIQKEHLQDFPDPVFWVDGSGISRYNLITPADIVALLTKINSEVSREKLMELLPAGGQTGTIKNMFKDQKAFIFAKTGSLRNTYNLSGYLLTNKGRWLIFSFMNINSTRPSEELKKEMESMLLEVRNKY